MYKLGDKVKLVPFSEIPDWDKIPDMLKNEYLRRQDDTFVISDANKIGYLIRDSVTGYEAPFGVKECLLKPYDDEENKEMKKEFATLIF